nr:retrovirus-related Pol polyprotein from transposon TNT 1-94 [Tanacetum cinerariifolium]
MGCLQRSACLGSLSLTQSLNSLVLGESLEIRDNHLCAIWEHMSDSEWSRPTGLKLAREHLQSRVQEEGSITNVENAVFDFGVMEPLSFLFCEGQSLHASKPSKLCAQAQSVDDMPFQIDIKRMDVDDQAIQTILLGIPKDVYDAIDSYEIAKEIWEHVRQMMKGSDIREQEKKVKLFNEWEKFTSTDGESIESYYHRFMQLMNDLKRNKYFPENIASNLNFLNNLQPEWKRHITIVRQTKNLHEADFTKIYDFLKMNQDEVNELRAERLIKSHDPLALMAHSQNSFNFPTTHKDQSSSSTHTQQSFPINNKYNPQPSLNQNFVQPQMTSLEDINGPTEAMNAILILFAKAFQLTAPINNNQRTSSNPRNRQIAQLVMNMSQDRQTYNVGGNGAQNAVQNASVQNGGNQNRLVVVPGIANQNETGNVVAARAEGIQLQAEEFDFMATASDPDEIEEVNANCILMANLQHASTSGTQLDKAPVYDTNGSAEVKLNDNCYDNEIFNMFTQEEQYTDLLEPIPEPQLVPQNDNHVTSITPKKKKPKHDFKTQKDKFLDNEVDLEAIIKDFKNILLKRDQTVQTMHMLNPKPESFFHPNQKMALGYPNPSYLKKAQLKQQSLYNGNLLLEEHDPPAMYDSEETLELAQEIDARVQNFKIQFLQEATKFVRDFKSLAKEADESLDKKKSLELEIERLLKASVKKLELCIIKKEKEYVVLWNNWYTKCEECKYDKISYDKDYNGMQQKFKRLQAQLRDLKGKSSNTPIALNTIDPLNQKLELKIVELGFQVANYECEISHLKTTYKNLFDSIKSNWAHARLYDLIYGNAQLRARVFENTFESMKNTSGTSVTPHVDKPKLCVVTPQSKKLHASMPSHSVPQPREFNFVKHRNVIAPGMFKINPSQTPRVDLVPNKQSSASIRTNPITNSQRHVIVKEIVSFNTVTAFSTGLVHTVRTRRPQPKGNTRNARVPSASKSSEVKKIVTVEDHRRTLLLSKNQKQCLVTTNHDACLPSSVNTLNSRANKLCDNVLHTANPKRHRTKVWKPKQVGSKERLAPKPRLPRFSLKWSPSGRSFDLNGKLVASKEINCPNDDKACTFNPQEPMRKWFPNSTVFLGRLSKFVCGYGDLTWGNITITRVYFVEDLGHNLFLVGQFCNADLEIAFRRNTCFIRDLDGVDLLKGNRSINLYTINLYDMASASPICLMARATPTKSWLWHQRLSHLNFDTINDLAKNDLVSGLPNFKYAKEHLCPSCEQGKSKRTYHPPKPVLNSMQRLHLLHMDLYGPMRVASIKGKRYVLVIVDHYPRRE